MIKLICIKKNDSYPYKTIEKNSIVFSLEDDFYNNLDWFGVITNGSEYLGVRNKRYFTTFQEWRNQQIDKILN